MSTPTLTNSLVPIPYAYVHNRASQLSQAQTQRNSLLQHLATRVGYAGLAVLSFITLSSDTFIGIGSGIVAVTTLGKIDRICQFASDFLNNSNYILSVPYQFFLLAINPNAKMISRGYSESIINIRYPSTRSEVAVDSLFLVSTRIFDVGLSLLTAPLSICLLGYNSDCNAFAAGGLKFPGIIKDLFFATMKLMNYKAHVSWYLHPPLTTSCYLSSP